MNSSPSSLTLRAATQRWSQAPVLDAVDLTLRPGERVGVVGDNGSGKSTLLGVLAGVVPLAAGERRAFLPGGLAHAPQTLSFPAHLTIQQVLDASPADLRAMEQRLRELEQLMATEGSVMAEYADLTTRFEARAGHLVEVRLAAALARLGLGGVDHSRRVGTLSGGEQARLSLALTLSAEAEFLLLDEPTNDLDDDALAWLEERLLRHRGTSVVVTHDRVFLQRLTDSILEVEDGRVRRYGNGWSGYLSAKKVERDRQQFAHDQWVADLHRNRELLANNAFRLDAIPRSVEKPGFGHGAFRARDRGHGAMSRIRAAKERLARLADAPVAPPTVPLRLTTTLRTPDPAPTPLAPPPPTADTVAPGVRRAYVKGQDGEATVAGPGSAGAPARSANAVAPGVRRANLEGQDCEATVAGPGSAGAPTSSADTVAPEVRRANLEGQDAGPPLAELEDVVVDHRLRLPSLTIRPGGRVLVTGPNGAGKTTLLRVIAGVQPVDSGRVSVAASVGHLRQDLQQWPPGVGLLEAYAAGRPDHPTDLIGELLAHGLFRAADVSRPVRELSVGQQRRLDLARLLAGRHDLLLLDEPTNHLTPALMDELEQALDAFPGAVVLVTHDRLLRSRFRGTRLELADGEVVRRSA